MTEDAVEVKRSDTRDDRVYEVPLEAIGSFGTAFESSPRSRVLHASGMILSGTDYSSFSAAIAYSRSRTPRQNRRRDQPFRKRFGACHRSHLRTSVSHLANCIWIGPVQGRCFRVFVIACEDLQVLRIKSAWPPEGGHALSTRRSFIDVCCAVEHRRQSLRSSVRCRRPALFAAV